MREELKLRYTLYLNILKCSEGGKGATFAREIVSGCKRVNCYTIPSGMIGYTTLVLDAASKAAMRRALSELQDYDYIESMSSEMKHVIELTVPALARVEV